MLHAIRVSAIFLIFGLLVSSVLANSVVDEVDAREIIEELESRDFLDASFVDSRYNDALALELDSRWDDEEEAEAREWEGDYIDERDFEGIDARFEGSLEERDQDGISLETRGENVELESRKPWMRHFRIGTVILPANWHWPGTQKSKGNPGSSTGTD